MSIPLVEALQRVELEIGHTYRCEVNGRWVELHVLANAPAAMDQAGPMMDPWVEFPPPSPQFRVHATPGLLPLPDVPEIPADEAGS